MPNDRHLQSITIGIFVFMSLVSLAMIRNDLTDISDPTLCSIIIVFRILFSGFILASCVIYIKSGRSRLFSNLVQLIISMTALISGVITWTRPPRFKCFLLYNNTCHHRRLGRAHPRDTLTSDAPPGPSRQRRDGPPRPAQPRKQDHPHHHCHPGFQQSDRALGCLAPQFPARP